MSNMNEKDILIAVAECIGISLPEAELMRVVPLLRQCLTDWPVIEQAVTLEVEPMLVFVPRTGDLHAVE